MFYTRCYVALIIMDKWKTYRSFDNWKNQNYNELMTEYEIGKNAVIQCEALTIVVLMIFA